jgi:hypothetical protein
MWNLFGRYKGKKVLPSARQMNLIAAILNHVTQGTGISMDTPQQPSTDSPWKIGIDVEWLKSFVSGGAITPSSLAGSDANGNIIALLALLSTAPTTDKALTVKANTTTLSWEDAGGTADNPTNKTSLADTYPGTDSANSSSWTSGGSNGVTVTIQTRTMWSGTYLYGFYRTFTFDKTGRLYSVSGETRYTIDTPVTYNT